MLLCSDVQWVYTVMQTVSAMSGDLQTTSVTLIVDSATVNHESTAAAVMSMFTNNYHTQTHTHTHRQTDTRTPTHTHTHAQTD